MHIGFLNPQGNFDSGDSHLSEHADFGGQLTYVKQLALEMAKKGHQIDIITRQIIDPEWPEFAEPFDAYPDVDNVRIIRLPAGSKEFLCKELLWPHLVTDWVPNILKFYREQGGLPDAMTTHYGDGGVCGVLIEDETGVPFTFTGHSLGAQKMDQRQVTPENLAQMDEQLHFGRRLIAERLSMNRSAVNITSTRQERFEQYSHIAYQGAVDVFKKSRFAVIAPGVDSSIFGSEARSHNEEATYQLVMERLARDITEDRQDLPVILASSRLAPKKNILGLVQAFALSQTLQDRANLLLITPGLDNPLHEEASDDRTEQEVLVPIREVVKENDLWGKISAFGLPDQPALAAIYRLMSRRRSVFALTSFYEPFGLGPLEAAAAGLPVVGTQNGGLSESLGEGDEESAVLVDPEEPADIANGLEQVICDTQMWEQLQENGQERVLSEYTWECTAKNYLALIEQIVAEPAARRPSEIISIHPYFRNPQPQTDVSLEELSHLYFGSSEMPPLEEHRTCA
jgi:sucrose-phosphate synthase